LTCWLHKHGKHGLNGASVSAEKDPMVAHRYLEAFRTLDASGTGLIDASTIGQALKKTHGLTLPPEELHALLCKLKLTGQSLAGESAPGGVGPAGTKPVTFAQRAEQMAAAAAAMGVVHGMGGPGAVGRRFMGSSALSPAALARARNPAIQRQAFVGALSSASEWEALLDVWRARKAAARAHATSPTASSSGAAGGTASSPKPRHMRRTSTGVPGSFSGAAAANNGPQPLLPFLLWIPAFQRLKLIEGAMGLSSGAGVPGIYTQAELHPPAHAPPAVHERAAQARAREAAIVARFERLLRNVHMPSGATLEQLWQATRAEVRREMQDLEDGRAPDSGFASPEALSDDDADHWAGEAVDPDTGLVVTSPLYGSPEGVTPGWGVGSPVPQPGLTTTVLEQWTPASPVGSNPTSVAPSPSLKPAQAGVGSGGVTSRLSARPSARRQGSQAPGTARREVSRLSSQGSGRNLLPNLAAPSSPLPALRSPFSPNKAAVHTPPVLLVGAFARARARVSTGDDATASGASGSPGTKNLTRVQRLQIEVAENQVRADMLQAQREAEALAHQMTERREMEEDDDGETERRRRGRRSAGIWRDLDELSSSGGSGSAGSSGSDDDADERVRFDPATAFEVKVVLTWIGPTSSAAPGLGASSSESATEQGWRRLLLPPVKSAPTDLFVTSMSFRALGHDEGWAATRAGVTIANRAAKRSRASERMPQPQDVKAELLLRGTPSASPRVSARSKGASTLLLVTDRSRRNSFNLDDPPRSRGEGDEEEDEADEAQDAFDAAAAPLPASLAASSSGDGMRHPKQAAGGGPPALARRISLSVSGSNTSSTVVTGRSSRTSSDGRLSPSRSRRRLALAEGEHVLSFVVNPLTELYKGSTSELGLALDQSLAATLGVSVSDSGAAIPVIDSEREHIRAKLELE